MKDGYQSVGISFRLTLLTFRMSFCKGITQSGSNADTLLADAYIKGIKDVPWQDAFQAIRKVPT
jgi:hypothetical protein